MNASTTTKVLESYFLKKVCREIIDSAISVPNGCVAECFAMVEDVKLMDVLERMIVQLCTYGFSDFYATGDPQMLQNQINFDLELENSRSQSEDGGGGGCSPTVGCGGTNIVNSTEFKDNKLDFYLIRKAHLQFMTRTGRVIGLQEVRNLAELTCTVLSDMGVAKSNVNLLRYRMSRINIMQVSGYGHGTLISGRCVFALISAVILKSIRPNFSV